MKRVLVSWIGGNDLKAIPECSGCHGDMGPVLSTISSNQFDKVYLLYNYPKKQTAAYLNWLSSKVSTEIEASYCKLSSPVHFGDIYKTADSALNNIWCQYSNLQLNILLSPGTPAMQAVWILLGKTRYPTNFIQSSVEQGVQNIDIPFDIAVEFLPELTEKSDKQLKELVDVKPSISTAFDDIMTQSPQLTQLKAQASLMANRDIPVLIYGETGTGKELFATAIHNASPRKNAPFITVNCGAIPSELVDSALFGHVKGAFTGASSDKDGYFQAADGGTLFLDEFGELPLDAQVRLLRVIQSGELTPVGSTQSLNVDVRIIAATNRNLMEEVVEGRFREDLFYRIAIGVIHLPPLREREGDIGLLADILLEKINTDAAGQPGYKHKKYSASGRNFILNQPWKGNIRELYSTLLRASLWSTSEEITDIELKSVSFDMPSKAEGVLNKKLGNGFEIQRVISQVISHYIDLAKKEAAGNKTKAAELLGLANYQTLKNWEKKYNNN